MKKYLTLSFLFVPILLFSQLKGELSDPITVDEPFFNFIQSFDDNVVVSMKNYKNTEAINILLNKNLKPMGLPTPILVQKSDIKKSAIRNYTYYTNSLIGKNATYTFFQYNDKEKEKVQLIAQKINAKGIIEGDSKIVDEHPAKNSSYGSPYWHVDFNSFPGKYMPIFNHDSTQIALIFEPSRIDEIDKSQTIYFEAKSQTIYFEAQKALKQLRIRTIDLNFNTVQDYQFQLPYEDIAIRKVLKVVFLQDKLFFLLSVDETKIPKSTVNPKFSWFNYKLIAVDMKNKKWQEIIIEPKGVSLSSVRINSNFSGDKLYCMGLYQKFDSNSKAMDGLASMTIHSSNYEVSDFKFKEFNPYIKKEKNDMNDKNMLGNCSMSYFNTINHLLPLKDGGFYLITEDHTFKSTPGYLDVTVLKLDKNINILTSSLIHKNQEVYTDTTFYGSYAPFLVNERLFVIYNDPSYLNTKKNKFFTESLLIAKEITNDGSVLTHNLNYDSKKTGFHLMPLKGTQLTDNTFVIPSGPLKNKDKLVLFRISLK